MTHDECLAYADGSVIGLPMRDEIEEDTTLPTHIKTPWGFMSLSILRTTTQIETPWGIMDL